MNHHNDVPYRILENSYSFGDDSSGNMIIHGDNLEALKSLLPEFEGKVRCIYIDPPYNTGNEGWVYNDNVNDPRIRKWLGEVVGKEGDDLSRHDKWLCMMYPRLRLLQKLLADDGAIFISIDDTEYVNLKAICDEIFGAHCFVSNISWQRTYSTRNDSKGIVNEVEHILVYSKIPDWQPKKLPRTADMDSKYKNPDNDKMPWTSSDAFAAGAASHQGGDDTPSIDAESLRNRLNSMDQDDSEIVNGDTAAADEATLKKDALSIDQMISEAESQTEAYENSFENESAANDPGIPFEVEERMKTFPIRSEYREEAKGIVIPQFMMDDGIGFSARLAMSCWTEPSSGRASR